MRAGAGRHASVKIEGAAALHRQLRELPRKVERQLMRQALRAGAHVIRDAARREAPKETGALAESIVVRAAKKMKRGTIGVNVQTSEGFFQGDQFYAGFIEFGWQKQPTIRVGGRFKSLPRGYGRPTPMPPNPFMRRAADQSGKAAANIALITLRRAILANARRG